MNGKEKLEDLLVTLSALFSDYFDVSVNDLDFADRTEELSKGDQIAFGNLMIDVHEYYRVEVDYEAEMEYALFPTVNSVCTYFLNKI